MIRTIRKDFNDKDNQSTVYEGRVRRTNERKAEEWGRSVVGHTIYTNDNDNDDFAIGKTLLLSFGRMKTIEILPREKVENRLRNERPGRKTTRC